MEDTKKTRKTTNKSKNKNNYDPKWKSKKEGTTATPKKVVKKKTTKKVEKSPSASIKKSESGKKVDKSKLTDKYNIEKTMPIELPSKEELDRIYDKITEQEKLTAPEEPVIDKSILKKKHYNYLSRICTLVALIILFLVLCVIFVFKAFDYQLGGSITYSEYTSNDYKVCTNAVSVYNADNCLGKDLDYISNLVKNIHATFNYEAAYNSKYALKSKYSVIAKLTIFEQNDATRIRYIKDDTLINDTVIDVSGEVIAFSVDTDIDFAEYRRTVQQYIAETGVSSSAELEVGLYLKDGDVTRKISYLTIPLAEESFMIKSSNLDNQNQLVLSNIKTRIIDPFYIFIAVICLLMDVLLFTYLINFMYMVEHLDNRYNAKLKAILKEYDEFIVNATSSYVIPEDANVIEVESFEELMDARNTLEKPVVYERINNIKSKFYVEDRNTIYLYTMKDDGK